MKKPKWIILMCLIVLVFSDDEDQNNDINGEPVITCAADAIYVKFRTTTAFKGHVDVKFMSNRLCFQSLITANQIEVLIPHEECNLTRRRSLHPAGVIVESVISIAFNPEFTTANDKVFHVNCFHQKRSTNGTTGLQNGTPKLPPVERDAPTCDYQVVSQRSGKLVGRVSLGERVQHKWSCNNIYNSCITVTKCVLVAGDKKHSLIDAVGCSIHEHLMPHPVYDGPDTVSVNISVFGVSSTGLVHFACDIALQPRLPTGKCPRPECGSPVESARTRRSSESGAPAIDVRSQNMEISQLENSDDESTCQQLFTSLPTSTEVPTTVSETMTTTSIPTTSRSQSKQSPPQDDDIICVNTITVVLLTVMISLISAILASSAMCLFRTKKYEVSDMI